MLASLFLISFFSLFMGRYTIHPGSVLKILGKSFFGIGPGAEDTMTVVVMNIRLPRVLLNILVGCGLAVAGAAYQGLFQNPLVSPDILGVSAGAGFGASLGIILTSTVGAVTTILAFLFGLASVFLSYIVSKIGRDNSVLPLVLSGIIVSSVFNALISMMKFIADTEEQLPAITFWLMGSFSNTAYGDVISVLFPVLAGTGMILLLRWKMNILSLGDEEAYAMGLDPKKIRVGVIIAATFVTASCVTVTGIIGWIGLILPNMCRLLTGSDHRYLLPLSCAAGSIFMVLVDILSRSLIAAEIPVSVLTALVGAPFFVLVFRQTGSGRS
ncbi:MAG: iron ABC transporter permease [Treponema sp.]|nr:iron ABC transporter permease [Treponema sp.]